MSGWIDGFLAREDRRGFLRETETILRHDALVISDGISLGGPPFLNAVRRLAGEREARYALLMDRRGVVIASAGTPPSSKWEPFLVSAALSARDGRMAELPENPPVLEAAQPLWVGGRRWGVLRWGRWADGHAERRRANRRRLLFGWAVAALAGAVGTCLYIKALNEA